MIFQAMDIIRQELVDIHNDHHVNAELGNISEIINNINNNGVNADVIISLINIEENRVSRDPNNYIRKDAGIIMKNPAVHLYLTLLFTSVRHPGAYGFSLQDIQNVIGFFQEKNVFDHSNTPALDAKIEKLVLDMVSLNLQQLHEIWSVLGGKYYPSVAYKMRMVTIDTIPEADGALVKEVIVNF